ncbi:SDR family NAD(P)-dependent oxidoreductase [Benzoatithermus flavus]|uniref:SDR family NAD(P)-dependent oxidoreductase n=1 Tax=Benzoatithermus flavus TaxID=3108223 RepID=A0ABU8XMM4_9PROT
MDIAGQVAIVTGAASGLGRATAQALAAAGAVVALIDLDEAMVTDAARAMGGHGFVFDVADAAAAEAAMPRIEALGPLRLLVNCAGVAPAGKIVGRDGPMDLAVFERVVRVNLIGTFNLMRLAAAVMAKQTPNAEGERGVIVNTASIAAFEGQIGQAAYAAAKGGVASLTLPAAREFASLGIRVVAIAPGLFGTPMLLSMPEKVQESLAASVPFPSRFGRPEEYAALVLHILANPMLNGSILRLDGALRMAPR